MEKGETKNLHEQLSESHASVDASWLTDNIAEVNQSYNQIRELIENGAEPFLDKSDAYYEKQSQLIAHVEKILHKHQLLAEQFEKLQSCNDNSSGFHQQNGGDAIIGFSDESCFQTPDTKSNSIHVNAEAPLSVSSQMSGDGSSDTYVKEGSEYSAISSDSDSETFKTSAYRSARSHLNAHRMLEHHFVDKEEVGRGEGLLGRMTKYEEELSHSDKKLQLSEREVSRLEKELKELTGTFESQLESAQNELQKQEISLEMEKKNVAVLRNQVSVLKCEIESLNSKIERLARELDLAKLNLESSKEEINILKSVGPLNDNSDYSTELTNQLELAQQQGAMLDAKLEGERRQSSELQDKVQQYICDISNRDDLIQKMKSVLEQVTAKSCDDEAHRQTHIYSLQDHISFLEVNNEEWGNRCESLEEQIQQCEAAMTEMRRLHEVKERKWQNDIDRLKTELNEKDGLVKIKKGLDTLKLKCDVLEAEKATANYKVEALEAELGSKENDIQQMKDLLHQLHLEKLETNSISESVCKQYEDVRLKLKELEKEMERQKNLILDIAEEKREAIRQLCYTVEYYRNCYEELLQACKGLKRRCSVAS